MSTFFLIHAPRTVLGLLFLVSAIGEKHLLVAVGAAVLAQTLYVGWWRSQRVARTGA